MKGFKSFARETVINLDKHMNVVVGPNGSGKSNITDALCFVLGRLSIKSIRAAKSSHLIFSGNKHFKPASIGYVEIAWDNEDRTFSLEEKEVIIRRTVKKNGQSVYKINNQVKTRQEVIELLSQAGIDPHGFNMVLQGEIQKFVKMHGEERRKVIEEVAGISIYEMRKEKSLKELEKTNEKLRQVSAILRERTNYLKNLENEREQALRHKKLELTVKRCKGSIINRNIIEKQKTLSELMKRIELKNKDIEKLEAQTNNIQKEIESTNNKINEISKTIQKSSGVEQDSLLTEISNLKQEFAGMTARKENYENQSSELTRRKEALINSIKSTEDEIKEMAKEKGKNKKEELVIKKQNLENYEEEKRKYFLTKSQLSSLNTQLEDKKRQIQRMKNESNFLLEQIEDAEEEIKIKEPVDKQKEALISLKDKLVKDKETIIKKNDELLKSEKRLAILDQKIKESNKIKKDVEKLDICPLCHTNITKEHIEHIIEKSDKDISNSEKEINNLENKITNTRKEINSLTNNNQKIESEIKVREIAILKLGIITDKKSQLRRNNNQIKNYEEEIENLETKIKSTETKIKSTKITEEQYEKLKLEVNELERSEERNLGVEITSKQRELDRMKLAIKQINRDQEEINEELEELSEGIDERELIINEKEESAEILRKKYQKMYEEKNQLQDQIRSSESHLLKQQNEKRVIENEVNNLNIEKAQINGKLDGLKEDLKAFENIEFINIPVDKLKAKLENAEIVLARIGNVNMRALEVYDNIKEEYDKIREKVEHLEKEKGDIIKIIEQIDRKKKKTFMQTLHKINELFSRNFSQLSEKGLVSIEPQDKKEVFNSGLSIIVKVGAGKYFDITSLSGGEQTLVALSLIFAIQELNPYCFYIFDEIDATLDRRNSE
ncbi:hypothetical protein CMI42_00825, partial [Candidatus Pacearchaeota archaeon]|nr:hypothetical protein [Candidatus Pacearchaeota archaeon]